jgi:hypothetical protein
MLAPETVLIRALEISLVCLQCARAQNHTRTFTHAPTHTFIHARTHRHIHIDTNTNHMQMKKGKIDELERQKNFFFITLFVVFLVLAWFTSWAVIFSSLWHHSLIFNPWGDRYSDNVLSTWVCFVLHVIIGVVFWFSGKLTWFAENVIYTSTTSKAFTLNYEARQVTEISGFLAQFSASVLQAAIPEGDVDEEYYPSEEESENDDEDPPPPPPPQVRKKKRFSPEFQVWPRDDAGMCWRALASTLEVVDGAACVSMRPGS